MSHSNEPSYYEIALTNRQVLIVFVVLLICVVAAFFSGVWIGRGEDGAVSGTEIAQESATAVEAAAEESAAVDELHFFSDREQEAAADPNLARIAEEPESRTTLLEDLGGGEPETEEAPTPEPQPVEEERSAPASRQPASESASTTAASTGYVIQVFSSADQEQAEKLVSRLGAKGYPAFISPVEVGTQTMMRVRIGPYSQLKEAESVAERIRREFKLDTWVTR